MIFTCILFAIGAGSRFTSITCLRCQSYAKNARNKKTCVVVRLCTGSMGSGNFGQTADDIRCGLWCRSASFLRFKQCVLGTFHPDIGNPRRYFAIHLLTTSTRILWQAVWYQQGLPAAGRDAPGLGEIITGAFAVMWAWTKETWVPRYQLGTGVETKLWR